jgi:hypothetical protein
VNNREELIEAHNEVMKSLTLKEVMTFYNENGLKDEFENILFSMPKKSEVEELRKALIGYLINQMSTFHTKFTEAELVDSLDLLLQFRKETK